jgi:hypothetical protein
MRLRDNNIFRFILFVLLPVIIIIGYWFIIPYRWIEIASPQLT